MDNWLTEEKIIAEYEAEQRILRKKGGEDSIENVMAHDIARAAALIRGFDKEKKE